MDKLVVERSIWIAAPRERVWQAVTDPAQIQQWFSPTIPFSQNGDRISIHMNGTDMEVAVIELIDPPHRITTRSLMDGVISTTYTLEEENGGTRFTVTQTGYELLPEDARRERYGQDGKGWEMALQNLLAHIQGRSLPHPEGF